MLELTGENLKVAIIILLKGIKENMLVINEQTGNISHCIETKKEQKLSAKSHQHLPLHCKLCFSLGTITQY